MDHDQASAFLKKKVAEISEHFECVLIAVSWQERDETGILFEGSGNSFAILGMAQEYLNRDKQDELATAIAEKIDPEE